MKILPPFDRSHLLTIACFNAKAFNGRRRSEIWDIQGAYSNIWHARNSTSTSLVGVVGNHRLWILVSALARCE